MYFYLHKFAINFPAPCASFYFVFLFSTCLSFVAMRGILNFKSLETFHLSPASSAFYFVFLFSTCLSFVIMRGILIFKSLETFHSSPASSSFYFVFLFHTRLSFVIMRGLVFSSLTHWRRFTHPLRAPLFILYFYFPLVSVLLQ